MKNQYFADVGDFGKYGMLNFFSKSNLILGFNWYLTRDDNRTDGKFIDYFNKLDFLVCNSELHDFLHRCVVEGRRNVDELSNFSAFESTLMFTDILQIDHIKALSPQGRAMRLKVRHDWFKSSMNYLSDCDIIFCDPDNGIETRSLSTTGKDSVKYVLVDEIKEMVEAGKSVICYNHRDRSKESDYFDRFKEVALDLGSDISLRVLRFGRYSVRDYLFFIRPEHEDDMTIFFENFNADNNWNRLFTELELELAQS